MTIPACPVCGSSEFVSLLKSGRKACCEQCGSLFDVPSDAPAPRKKLKLFLSYPHTAEGEYNICNDIAAFLQGRGHEVWFDREQLGGHYGTDWRRKIAEGIRDSQLVVSCLNRHAVRTENGRRGVCLDELSIAVSVKGGNINTVLLEPEKVVKPSAALSHRQWLDLSAWREKYKAGEAVYRQWLEKHLEALARMVESDENYSFDGEITEIAKKLAMSDYRLDKRELLEKPFVGREWLARETDAWISRPDSRGLCAIYGDPGVGKSAFAVQYAFSSPNVGAIICFEYGKPHYNSVPAMVHAMAFQLACRLSDYRAALLDTLRRPGVMDLADAELFDCLLIKPLRERHVDGGQENLCVILDGLDECGKGEQNAAASVLGQCADKFPPWLRVLVTSRREAAVLTHLAPDAVIELHGKDERNLEDIRTFFIQSLAGIIPDGNQCLRVAEKLTSRSEGAFLYAYLTSQAIREGILDPLDEKAYPARLGRVLTLWMERLFPDLREYRERFRLPVGALLAAPEPLPEEELERLLGMSESGMRDLKRRLKVFLTEGTDSFGRKALSFEHRFVQDWLGSEEAGVFCVSARDGLRALAGGCFEVLQDDAQHLTGFEALWIIELLENAGLREELRQALCSRKLFLEVQPHAEWCRIWGNIDKAKHLYQNMHRNAQYRMEEIFPEAREDLAFSCRGIADICRTQGKPDEALAWYRKALEIRKHLAEEQSSQKTRRELLVCYSSIADIQKSAEKWDEALEGYQKALDISMEMAEEGDSFEARRDLALSFNRIADIRKAQGKTDEALEGYRKALEIILSMMEVRDTPKTRRDLALTYNRIADICKAQGKQDEALQLYRKTMEITMALCEEQNTPKNRRDLLICCNKIGGIYEAQGNLDQALEMYRKALELSSVLAEERNTPEARRDLSISYNNIGGIHELREQWDEALSWYQKSLKISRALAEGQNSPKFRRDLDYVCKRIASVQK